MKLIEQLKYKFRINCKFCSLIFFCLFFFLDTMNTWQDNVAWELRGESRDMRFAEAWIFMQMREDEG